MISPENVAWAFFSEHHREIDKENAIFSGKSLPKDAYYKDMNGKWVLVTAVFECIDTARKSYRHGDVKYLGAVDRSTKVEVAFGQTYPPPAPVVPVMPIVERPARRKKMKSPAFSPGTITVSNKKNVFYDYFDEYGGLDQKCRFYYDKTP